MTMMNIPISPNPKITKDHIHKHMTHHLFEDLHYVMMILSFFIEPSKKREKTLGNL